MVCCRHLNYRFMPVPLNAECVRSRVMRAWNTRETTAVIHFVPLSKKKVMLTVKSINIVTVLIE